MHGTKHNYRDLVTGLVARHVPLSPLNNAEMVLLAIAFFLLFKMIAEEMST